MICCRQKSCRVVVKFVVVIVFLAQLLYADVNSDPKVTQNQKSCKVGGNFNTIRLIFTRAFLRKLQFRESSDIRMMKTWNLEFLGICSFHHVSMIDVYNKLNISRIITKNSTSNTKKHLEKVIIAAARITYRCDSLFFTTLLATVNLQLEIEALFQFSPHFNFSFEKSNLTLL